MSLDVPVHVELSTADHVFDASLDANLGAYDERGVEGLLLPGKQCLIDVFHERGKPQG
jgi:hypothetical protein